jgi:hypothetical protein
MTIQKERATIDDQTVTTEAIAGAIQKRMTDETELWICDARHDGTQQAFDNPMPPLPKDVAISPGKVFRVYVPGRQERKANLSVPVPAR